MIGIPEEYVKRIVTVFGEEGENWLNSIEGLIKKYENEFEIQHLNYFKHSMNLLFERIF